jgi:penicillin-binding protein 1A
MDTGKQKVKPKEDRSFSRYLVFLLSGFSLLIFISGLVIYFVFSKELPQLTALQEYSPNTITEVLSQDGEPIAEYYVERRIVVPMSTIPDHVINAFLAAEDAKFFEHKGINFKRILGALIKNIEAGRVVQGGSTITQQVVKTLLLTPEKSLSRKIREAILAFRLERNFSKEEILHLYLNHIYLGNGAYGIQAAAENYFGKNVQDLTIPEVAILAGLPKAPNRYSPYTHADRALERQRYVIEQMLSNGFISLDEASEAVNEPIMLRPRRLDTLNVAPYFSEHIRRYIEENYGYDALYKGGLQVFTTLNVEYQKAAQEAVKSGLHDYDRRQGYRGPIERLEGTEEIGLFKSKMDELLAREPLETGKLYKGVITEVNHANGSYTVSLGSEKGRIFFKDMQWAKKVFKPRKLVEEKRGFKYDGVLRRGDVVEIGIQSLEKDQDGFLPLTFEQEVIAQAALIAMDPHTGEVRAMVGGVDFSKSQFNRAIQSRRQPGSAFKPIVYAAAIDKGYTPSSIIVDSPIIYEEEKEEEYFGFDSEEFEFEINDGNQLSNAEQALLDSAMMDETEDNIQVWKPKNFDKRFHGPTTLREALARSRNLVTIKLLRDIKVGYAVNYARKLGISSPLTKDLSLALGSSGVSLIDLTRAYSVFASGGKKVKPIFITKILDREGNVLEDNKPESETAISPETAFLMTNMLRGVVERGTGWKAKALGRPSAGKTGTTNNYIDAWYLGYIPNLVSGVWIGYDDERTLGRLETGSRAALPIWLDFMKKVTEDMPTRTFTVPGGIVFARIDPETGLLAPPGMEGTIFESFKAGTVPKEMSVQASYAPSSDFFKLDQ